MRSGWQVTHSRLRLGRPGFWFPLELTHDRDWAVQGTRVWLLSLLTHLCLFPAPKRRNWEKGSYRAEGKREGPRHIPSGHDVQREDRRHALGHLGKLDSEARSAGAWDARFSSLDGPQQEEPRKYTGEDRTDPVKKAETLWFGKNQELRGKKGLGSGQDSPWRTVPHRKFFPTS